MYPDSDSHADQFDDALERRRSGDDQPDDPQIEQLVRLATRLEHSLPEDTPDPAFRNRLKQELLSGDQTAREPVDLAEERWHRRLVASPWRVSAAAATVLVVVAGAVAMAMDPLGGDDDGASSDTISFQALDQDESVEPDDSLAGFTGQTAEAETMVASSFPPFDHEHIVLPPVLRELLFQDEPREPDVELNGADEMVQGADMPDTAPVFYLSAPPDAEMMLTTLRSTLGVEGEIVPGSSDGEPYRVVNQDEEPVISWDPATASFHFRGEALDEPVTGFSGGGAGPADIAVDFLEQIGFDLNTIQYEHRVIQEGENRVVELRPVDFPDMGLEMSLGGWITINAEGAITEAQLYWLSLIDRRDAVLRDPEEILQDIEQGDGYMPPMPESEGDGEMWMDVDDVRIAHVLTRLEEGSFVLQPALALTGEYADVEAADVPVLAEYVVKAAEDDE